MFYQFINKIGVVHRITDKGDVRVQYEGCPTRWTIHPAALAKTTTFKQGDAVTIATDEEKVKEYQKGHGEWIDYMKSVSNFNYEMLYHCFAFEIL